MTKDVLLYERKKTIMLTVEMVESAYNVACVLTEIVI